MGPARGCQGEPSDSGARGRLRGLSETWRGKRRRSGWNEDRTLSLPGQCLERPSQDPPPAAAGSFEAASGEVGVGVHEKNLGSSYLMRSSHQRLSVHSCHSSPSQQTCFTWGRRQTRPPPSKGPELREEDWHQDKTHGTAGLTRSWWREKGTKGGASPREAGTT